MKSSNNIYIILVNFGQWEHTIDCLESIRQNEFPHFRVIIVDVLNLDQSLQKLSTWIEKVHDDRFLLIEEKQNKGFAYANNVGIKHALKNNDCEFIWVLNNDTVIHAEALQQLLDFYQLHQVNEKIGFIGSKTMDFKKKDVIQNVGGTFNPRTGYSTLIGMGEKDLGQFDGADIAIDYVVGASMFFNKSLIDNVELMPESYFLYYEDIDWCISAQKKGYKNLSCANSIIYHKQGVSTGSKLLGGDTHLKNKKYLYSSYLTFYKRHYKKLMPVAYLILLKQLAGRMYHKNFAEAKLISQVIFSNKQSK